MCVFLTWILRSTWPTFPEFNDGSHKKIKLMKRGAGRHLQKIKMEIALWMLSTIYIAKFRAHRIKNGKKWRRACTENRYYFKHWCDILRNSIDVNYQKWGFSFSCFCFCFKSEHLQHLTNTSISNSFPLVRRTVSICKKKWLVGIFLFFFSNVCTTYAIYLISLFSLLFGWQMSTAGK